jgi:hypothetical protein
MLGFVTVVADSHAHELYEKIRGATRKTASRLQTRPSGGGVWKMIASTLLDVRRRNAWPL